MSTRFIDLRRSVKSLLVTALLAGCSAPMPIPPASAPPAHTPAAAAPAGTAPVSATPPAGAAPDTALQRQFDAAVAAMQTGQDELAASLFTVIAKQHPRLASPYTNLGILLFRKGRSAEAEAAFKEALQRDDKDYVAANYLGMIYRGLGRFNDARAAYEQALAAKPDYAYAHLNLAILYDLYLGDLPKALDHYQQYRQFAVDADQRLPGWLADLQQRMTNAGETSTP